MLSLTSSGSRVAESEEPAGAVGAVGIDVDNALSLEVLVDVDAAPLQVQLAAIHAGDHGVQTGAPICNGDAAAARAGELVASDTVQVEVEPAIAGQHQVASRLGYVWLADGRGLGEILLREGLARTELSAEPYAYEDAYTAAQSEAIGAGRGIWAPGACPAIDPPPGLSQFVTNSLNHVDSATTALLVLREQTELASAYAPALSQPGWRQSTGYMLGVVRTAGEALRGSQESPAILEPLAERLAGLGRDLLVGADAYGLGLDAQDPTLLASANSQLQTTATSLEPLARELVAVATKYRVGD